MPTEMTLDRFRRLLEAYGAAPKRWPAAEREAALALRDSSEQARALLTAGEALDSLLDEAPAQVASAAVTGSILAARPMPAATAGWWRLLFGPLPLWQPLAALALAAILGFGLGSTGGMLPPEDDVVVVDVAAVGFAADALAAEENE